MVVIFVSMVVDVVVVFAGVFHLWFVRGAVGGAAGAGTATRVPGSGLGGSPARCAPAGARSSSVRHCPEVVEIRGRASAPYLAHQLSVSDSH